MPITIVDFMWTYYLRRIIDTPSIHFVQSIINYKYIFVLSTVLWTFIKISTPDSQMSNSLTVAYCPYFKNPHIHQFRAIRMNLKKGFLIWQAPFFSQEFFKDMNKNILLSGIISFHLDFLHLTQIWRFFFLVLQWLKFKNPYATLFGQLDLIERTIKHEEKSPVVFILSIEILNF